ncbi:MAG TPA: hypothetical protein VN325_23310 [Steroidobacteraceae bacterium]|nr:hypothetical protein [Steroidobacteraceae bacterium]
MIYRSWFCLNKHCKSEFTVADADHPPCPRCGGLHVRWLPKPFGIKSERTKQADKAVKEVIETYGDKNYVSPTRYERMEPRHNPIPIKGQTRKYVAPGMDGWAAEIPVDKNGHYFSSYCAPTGVTAPVSAALNARTPVSTQSPSPTGSVPKFEARSTQRRVP